MNPVSPYGCAKVFGHDITVNYLVSKGLKLIAWTDRGIHYSLVSELGARGAESCIICHGRDDDRRVIEEPRPGRK